MNLRYVSVGLIGLALMALPPSADAQDKPLPTPPVPTGYEALDAELRNQPSLRSLLERGREELDAAVRAARFDRADSILVLLNQQVDVRLGAPSAVWPDPYTYSAVRLLAGEPAVLRDFAGDRWAGTLGAPPYGPGMSGDFLLLMRWAEPGRLAVGEPYRTALIGYEDEWVGRLRAAGASAEEAAFAVILGRWLARPLPRGPQRTTGVLSEEQESLNDAVEGFLGRYPDSVYGPFLREAAWLRYTYTGEATAGFDLGDGQLGSRLGAGFDGAILSGGLGMDVRGRYWHAGGHLRLMGLNTVAGVNDDGEFVAADKGHMYGELLATAGPRLVVPLGRSRLDVLPFVGAGLVNVSEATTEDGASYGFTRPALAYGGKVAVNVIPLSGGSVFAVFGRYSRTEARFDGTGAAPAQLTFGVEIGGLRFRRLSYPSTPRP